MKQQLPHFENGESTKINNNNKIYIKGNIGNNVKREIRVTLGMKEIKRVREKETTRDRAYSVKDQV